MSDTDTSAATDADTDGAHPDTDSVDTDRVDTDRVDTDRVDTDRVDTDNAHSDTDSAAPDTAAGAPTPARRSRIRTYLDGISFTGLVIATVFLWLSATPSLLPRGPLFQGIVSGAGAAIGYCLGAFLAWLARYLVSRDEHWKPPRLPYWIALGVAFVIGTAVMFYWFAKWQNRIRNLMDVPLMPWTVYPLVVVIALVVFVLLMALGQLWGAAVRWLVRKLNLIAPPRISAAVGGTVMVLLTVFILNGVVADYSMRALNATFSRANEETTATSVAPTSTLRSGGPGSLVTWNSLGREGRTFVSHGPNVAELSEFNGSPAMEPIRSFVGLGSGPDLRANAEIAADELVRAGGLRRAVVAVGSATGSGWVNRATVDTLEYMYNGDVATVVMQYSYLPSWLSFIVDSERARQAGSALFEAVDERIRELPEDQRPRLVVFGESLGSYGAEAAFGTVPTIAARTDGALLTGPTFNNTLWKDATSARDRGSPEWLPIYDDGRQVRFIADARDLSRPERPWPGARVVYLQHPSDPISWWSPDLILDEPDWLREPRGRDVLGTVQWIPLITFLQLSADMAVAVNVPDGHGHNYLSAIPYAWQSILQPPGWTEEKTRALLPRLTRD
ncbi:alpha/beta-hydrolase family protein [Gordonia sinesedis]